jgi:nitroimidazol reductase NimA-like FMN-containing flavoprotein (pyridoxamine 5'-phosphate oxidase superfamily)
MRRKQALNPRLRQMTRRQSQLMLSANHIGRVAYSFHDTVDIRPIHYVYRDGWIFGRTSPGDKLITVRHNQWVAFEIDEVAGPFDWSSVIAHGSLYPTYEEGSESDRALRDRAIKALRRLIPGAFTADDPVAFRTEVFAIHIDSLSGRSSSTKRAKR